MSCCEALLRVLLVLVNLLMVAVGGVMLIIGIVFKLDKEDLIELSDYSTSMAGVTLAIIVIGAVIALVGLLGCMGACLKKNGILNFYFVIVLVTLLLQVALIVFTIVKKDAVSSQLKEAVTDTFAKVKNETATDNEKVAVNTMMSYVKCCGLNGKDYWGGATAKVPAGCCAGYDRDGKSTEWTCAIADAYVDGCMTAGPQYVMEKAWVLLIIIIVIMVVEIVCMLGACYSKKQDLIA